MKWQSVRQFFRFPVSDRLLLLETFTYLIVSWMGIKLVPFRRIVPLLGQQMLESSKDITPAQQSENARISWAADKIGHQAAWSRNCYVQALAVKLMLKRRGISSTFYLGVAHSSEQGIGAHAWLRSGSQILTGAPEHRYYQVISTFAEEDS